MILNHSKDVTDLLANAISRDSQVCTTSNGSNTQIAAPGAGRRLIITSLSLVDTSAGAHTCILKSGSTSKGQLVLPSSGGQVYIPAAIVLGENEAFVTTDTAVATGTVGYAIVPA